MSEEIDIDNIELNLILAELGIDGKSEIIDSYIENIANKNLRDYQSIIQYGAKEGESLYIHILNCIFTLESLSEILNLSEIETKVLYTALTLHDINKLPNSDTLAYKHIVTVDNIENELNRLEFSNFFENWSEYKEDIKLLMLAHSGHSNIQGELLYLKDDNTKLGKKRLEELKFLVRAVDISDLSKDFYESRKKEEFLFNLNSFTKKQYKFIHHKVSEQRGILTNLLHKNTVEFFESEYNAIPVFNYQEGTYYLVDYKQELNIDNETKRKLGVKVANNISKLRSSKFDEYIGKDQKQGIKVAPDIIGLVTVSEIFDVINTKILKKKYKIEDKEAEDRTKILKKIEKAKPEEKIKLETLLSETFFYEIDQEKMKLGELIRTFYIFLNNHCDKELIKKNKSYKDTWNYVYEILDFPKDKIEFYSVSDPLYQRAYMLTKHISKSYDELFETFKNIASELLENNKDSNKKETSEDNSDIVEYSISNIVFSFENQDLNFSKYLINYVSNNHNQCSICNSSFKVNEMMASDVPEGIKVQQFSNRLGGGPGKPKRNICSICKEQFALEKLSFNNSSGIKPFYLHLMSHSFMPQKFLMSFRNSFKNLLGYEISNASINVKDIIKSLINESNSNFKISLRKTSTGMSLPKYPDEVVGNSIILPVSFMDDNTTNQYLHAVDYALLLNKYFNFKVVLTTSAIPIFNKNEFDEIYFDSLPTNLYGFIKKQNLTKDDLEVFWNKYIALKGLANNLYKDDVYLKLILSLLRGEQNIFHLVDRLIEDKTSNPMGAQGLSKKIYDQVEKIVNN